MPVPSRPIAVSILSVSYFALSRCHSSTRTVSSFSSSSSVELRAQSATAIAVSPRLYTALVTPAFRNCCIPSHAPSVGSGTIAPLYSTFTMSPLLLRDTLESGCSAYCRYNAAFAARISSSSAPAISAKSSMASYISSVGSRSSTTGSGVSGTLVSSSMTIGSGPSSGRDTSVSASCVCSTVSRRASSLRCCVISMTF